MTTTLTSPTKGVGDYFAVPDSNDPALTTYWRRTRGTLQPWPAKARYGPLLFRHDLPAGATSAEIEAFVRGWAADVRAPWLKATQDAVHADPVAAAARFAALTVRCAWCGRRLTDPRSKEAGIGPDCREGLPPAVVAAVSAQVARLLSAGWPANELDQLSAA